MTIMIHVSWIVFIDFIIIDISKVDENQLVLYAQMANLVKLILPSLELDLKEIAHTFSKVIPSIVFRMIMNSFHLNVAQHYFTSTHYNSWS
jgi:hypothetical protein